ncbi:MAG: hypothetical protein QME52_06945 [Bacteroidota bacterium]|nr:hypothetical protein [Bacteroidota bacterium]
MNTAFSQKQIESINYPDKLLLITEMRYQGDYSSMTVDPFDVHGKCGLWLSFEIARNWNQFSPLQKNKLQLLLSPKEFHKDTIIGYFHIFYDTTDYNEPALLDEYGQRIPNSSAAFVDSVGKYFNQSWNYFVDSLGYLPPPMQEGKLYYIINIENLGFSLYGETIFLDSDRIGNYFPPRYTSYIRIDNDFKDVYSKGIAGLKVTAAHEFHHAVQLGSYGFWNSDLYFYELTSTWMEDVVFDEINDYYQYLKNSWGQPKGQFRYPDISFTSSLSDVSYSRAIWGKFVEKQYSRNVMRRAWETIRNQKRTVQALDSAFVEIGSSFRQAFLEWATWNFNTGPNSDSVKYYTESRRYPKIITRPTIKYSHTFTSFTDSIQAISSVYRPICIVNLPSDSCTIPNMMVAVSNLDVNSSGTSQRFRFTYDIANHGDNTFTRLQNGIFVRLNAEGKDYWSNQEYEIDSTTNQIPSIVSEVKIYPHPFFSKGMKPLNFRLPAASEKFGKLYIYSVGMDLIIEKEVELISLNFEPKIEWNGHDSRGNLVPSGIYFYVITVDGKMYNGKFAVIRE